RKTDFLSHSFHWQKCRFRTVLREQRFVPNPGETWKKTRGGRVPCLSPRGGQQETIMAQNNDQNRQQGQQGQQGDQNRQQGQQQQQGGKNKQGGQNQQGQNRQQGQQDRDNDQNR